MHKTSIALLSVLIIIAGCGYAQNYESNGSASAQDSTSAKSIVDPNVQTIQVGQMKKIGPNLTMGADDRSPFLLFSAPDQGPIELSNEATLWDDGTETHFEVLGVRNDVESGGTAFAVRVTSKKAATPKIGECAKGSYAWSYNDPTSLKDGMTYSTISQNPLAIVGSSPQNQLVVVTNYGTAKLNGSELAPRSSGGGSEGVMTALGSAGPAHVRVSRDYGGRIVNAQRRTDLEIKVSNAGAYKGPIILNYKLPHFSQAASGLKVYVPPSAVPAGAIKRYDKSDDDVPKYWKLTMEPPILVEHGLGPQGVLTGPADISLELWKFGNQLYGTGGYTYSDTMSQAGGLCDGELKDGKFNLKLVGAPNLFLSATSVSKNEIKGSAKVSGSIAGGGYAPQPEGDRAFILTVSEPAPEPFGMNERPKMEAQLNSIPAGIKYWNALAVTPGGWSRSSLIIDTTRLMEAEQQSERVPAGSRNYGLESAVSALAHDHYCAWKSSVHQRGLNHPITKAHEALAEQLYRRMIAGEPRDAIRSNEHSMQKFCEILRETNREKDAIAIEEQLKKDKAQTE